MLPTISVNGTARETLLTQFVEAIDHVRDAIHAVSLTAPKVCDFPQGAFAFRLARDSHVLRIERLQSVQSELQFILEKL
jgi:hypothetical protein